MKGLALVICAAGCAADMEVPHLRAQPATINLTAEVGSPPAPVDLRIFADDREITASAQLSLTGVGALAGTQFISDGITGGRATIEVRYGGALANIPVTVHVHALRFLPGTPPNAREAFDAATEVAVETALEPRDGAVLPSNLGRLDIDFAADPSDDVHDVELTAPFVEIRVIGPGATGPRHVELTPAEWQALATTARGSALDVTVRSMQRTAPGLAHVRHAYLGIADLDASALLYTGATWAPLGVPQMWRYDMHTAQPEPFLAGANGTCLGCHVSVSPDGARIVAGAPTTTGLSGVIIDTATRSVIVEARRDDPWGVSAFDPTGRLVTANAGVMQLRDGTTGELLAPIAAPVLATTPVISADGKQLAFVVPTSPTHMAGDRLRVQSWSAATKTLGDDSVDIVPPAGQGVQAPAYSLDGKWLAYTTSVTPASAIETGFWLARADGSASPLRATSDDTDQLARFASDVRDTRVGDRDPEPMMWIAFVSNRAVGARAQAAKQLWLVAFFPEAKRFAQPIHLPGQPIELAALHAPAPVL